MPYHPSWRQDAQNIFELCLESHGGWAAWEQLQSLEFTLQRFRGALVLAKGLHRTFFPPKKVSVWPKKRKVDFLYENHIDSFEDGRVTFSPEKKIVANGRTLFRRSTFEQWGPGHAAYFFGYAWANYMSYPFILPQFELLNFQPGKRPWFQIQFPEEFHTHCSVQTFLL